MVRYLEKGTAWGSKESNKLLRIMEAFISSSFEYDPSDFVTRIIYPELRNKFLSEILTSYRSATKVLPHVTHIETDDTSSLWEVLKDVGLCHTTSMVVGNKGSAFGSISPSAVVRSMRTNTCLACICGADLYGGILQNIFGISKILAGRGVPLYSDLTALLGKAQIRIAHLGVDIAYAKVDCVMDIGILIVRKTLIDGFSLTIPSNVCVPIYAYAYDAINEIITNQRTVYTKSITEVKKIKDMLNQSFDCGYIEDYTSTAKKDIWFVRPKDDRLVLPGPLLLCVLNASKILDKCQHIPTGLCPRYVPTKLLPSLVQFNL